MTRSCDYNRHEEKVLLKNFPDYADHKKRKSGGSGKTCFTRNNRALDCPILKGIVMLHLPSVRIFMKQNILESSDKQVSSRAKSSNLAIFRRV